MSGGFMRGETTLRRLSTLGASAGLAFGLATLASGGAQAEPVEGALRGGSYGLMGNAKVGPARLKLDQSASAATSCRGTDGEVITESISSINAGSVLSGKLTRATAYGVRNATLAKTRQTAAVTGLSILGGMIRADSVMAVANVTAYRSKINASFSGSAFANLTINGQPISASTAPNTRIELPGVGSVTLKKVSGSTSATKGAITVEMLKVSIRQANRFGLPVGAELTVARASAGYDRAIQTDIVMTGQAYLTAGNAKAESATKNRIGRAALVGFGCEGTEGTTRRDSVASVSVDKVISLGDGGTTAYGGPTSIGGIMAKTTATADAVRLLNGLVTASSVKASAIDIVSKGVRRSSASGSSVSGLRVAGRSLGNVTERNVQVPLPGIGYLVLNEQFIPAASDNRRVIVNGMHLKVTQSNAFGLPIGSEFIIAHADSIARDPDRSVAAGS